MLAEAVPVLLGAQLASRLFYPRLGPRRLLAAGLTGVSAAGVLLGSTTVEEPLVRTLALLALLGLSWSQVFIPATAAAFARISDDDTARASTLASAIRQLGSATGIAAVAATLTADARAASTDSARPTGFLLASGIACLAAVVALFIRDDDAASTRPIRP